MKTRSYCRSLSVSMLLAAMLLGIAHASAPAKDPSSKAPGAPAVKRQKKARQSKGRLPNYYGGVVTEEQRQKIYDIQKEYNPEIRKLREQLKKLTADRDEKIDKVLTPEQREQIAELKQAAKEKRKKAKEAKQR